jgi:predicted nucleic acid-binding protein
MYRGADRVPRERSAVTVLIDTSVWIDHLRTGNEVLAELLAGDNVLIHPFVIGEIALGNLRNRKAVLTSLDALARPMLATHEEVLSMIDAQKLNGLGIGWIDAHLVASALMTGGSLWTRDGRLNAAAERCGVSLFP